MEFVKTTVKGGVFFLLPLVVMLLLLGQALKGARHLIQPLAKHFPEHTILNITLLNILAVLALVAVAFIAGLLVKTGVGQALGKKLERLILGKIPGYTLFKSAFGDSSELAESQKVQAVIVHFDESWMLGYVIERHDNGLLAVFVPSAPTPAAGTIYYLREDQVRPLQSVSVKDASLSVMRLGVGSMPILEEIAQQGWPDFQAVATPSVMKDPTAGNPSA